MKNFQELHKCAVGTVVNTEDFAKSKMLNTPSELLSDWPKRKKLTSWQKGQKKKCKGRCQGSNIN